MGDILEIDYPSRNCDKLCDKSSKSGNRNYGSGSSSGIQEWSLPNGIVFRMDFKSKFSLILCRTTTEEKRKRRKAIKDPKLVKEGDEADNKRSIKPSKSRAKPKGELMTDSRLEGDGDNHLNGIPTTKEEKIKSLKAVSVFQLLWSIETRKWWLPQAYS